MQPRRTVEWSVTYFEYCLPDGTFIDVQAEVILGDDGEPYVAGLSSKIGDTEIDFTDVYIRRFATVEMTSVHDDIEKEALALWMG